MVLERAKKRENDCGRGSGRRDSAPESETLACGGVGISPKVKESRDSA